MITKVKKAEPLFEDDELADRIREAFRRAAASPVFKEFRCGHIRLLPKQDAFVKLWIEEALRYAHIPSATQKIRTETEEQRVALLHLSLTPTQQRELLRISEEELPDDRANWRARKRIPLATYRVLHAAGLASTTHNYRIRPSHSAQH